MRKERLVLCAAVLGLAACESAPPPAATVAPTNPPNAAAAAAVLSAPILGLGSYQGHTLVGTQLAGPSTYVGPLPTSVVILTEGDATQDARNMAFCKSFVTDLPKVGDLLPRTPTAPNVIPLRWLLNTDTLTAADATNCDFLYAHYDWQQSGELIGSISLQNQVAVATGKKATDDQKVSWSGTGPFIVEIFPDNHVAIADASKVADKNLGKFAQAWLNSQKAQQAAITGQSAASVANATGAPTSKANGAAQKATSSSTGIWKDVYQIGTYLLSLIPAIEPAVKVVTTTISAVCTAIGAGPSGSSS